MEETDKLGTAGTQLDIAAAGGSGPQGPVGMWYLVSPTKRLAKPQVNVPSQNRRALYKTTRLKLCCQSVVMYRGSGGVKPHGTNKLV